RVWGDRAVRVLCRRGGHFPAYRPLVVALGLSAGAEGVGSAPRGRVLVPPRRASVEATDDPPFEADQEPFRGGAHGQRPLRTTSGSATASSTFAMIASAVTSSASASYDSTRRWRSTSSASPLTSSGST